MKRIIIVLITLFLSIPSISHADTNPRNNWIYGGTDREEFQLFKEIRENGEYLVGIFPVYSKISSFRETHVTSITTFLFGT